MPELAEVHYFAKQWQVGLGKPVVRVHLHPGKRIFRGIRPTDLPKLLPGQKLTSIHTHGKQMLFRFGTDRWLGVHLGMTGKLSAHLPNHSPSKHDHLVLHTKTHALVFQDPRLFGRIRFHSSSHPPDWWSSLPPEVLSAPSFLPRLSIALQTRARTPLKPILLLQEYFPGIGNWMADEILWRASLHPQRLSGSLNTSEATRLAKVIRQVCRDALHTIGRNWSDPPRSWLFLHRWKDGGKCPRCRTSLVRRPVGGRTTCWCPACQKLALPRRRHRS